jgi:hypothetical protein
MSGVSRECFAVENHGSGQLRFDYRPGTPSLRPDRRPAGDLTLQGRDFAHVGADAETWEKVVRKLRTGIMPPAGMPRPTQTESAAFVSSLEAALDHAARAHPDPGRPALHRLNRAEYSNAVRDLLSVNVDAASLLPPDNSALGFDNIAEVLSVSPSLLERYMSAARQISRLAIGDPAPRVTLYAAARDLNQDERVGEDLPLGSRGGLAIRHFFPVDGDYAIKLQLHRNVMEEIRGLADAHQVHFARGLAVFLVVSHKVGRRQRVFRANAGKRLAEQIRQEKRFRIAQKSVSFA